MSNNSGKISKIPFLAKRFGATSALFIAALMVLAALPTVSAILSAVNLGSAGNFAVLAGSEITNTGTTTITGDIGSHPTAPSLGGTITLIGTNHGNDAVTAQAKNDLVTAYNDAAGRATTQYLTGTDLGTLTLTPGVYSFNSSAQLTGTLTLDGMGVYIFKIGSTLTTASNSIVALINGAQAANVFWQVGSSATLGTSSTFKGIILALTSITVTTGANVEGRLLAQNGAVTLDTNTITAVSQTWRLYGDDHSDPEGINYYHNNDGASKKKYKQPAAGTGESTTITAETTCYWYADQNATVALTMPNTGWTSTIYVDTGGTATTLTGTLYKVTPGASANGGARTQMGTFTYSVPAITGIRTITGTWSGSGTTSFTVHDKLAFAMAGPTGISPIIWCNSANGYSGLSSPLGDPGYPVPELSTLILMTSGLIVGVWMLAYSNKKKK
jgi:hypothetical protein